jgi:hypothetical protein
MTLQRQPSILIDHAVIGEDNPSDSCTTGDVPNILEGSVDDHDGELLLYDIQYKPHCPGKARMTAWRWSARTVVI